MSKEVDLLNKFFQPGGFELKPIVPPKPRIPPGMEKRVEVEFLPAGIPPGSLTKPGYKRTVKESIAKSWEKRGQVKILRRAKVEPKPEPEPEKDADKDKEE